MKKEGNIWWIFRNLFSIFGENQTNFVGCSAKVQLPVLNLLTSVSFPVINNWWVFVFSCTEWERQNQCEKNQLRRRCTEPVSLRHCFTQRRDDSSSSQSG